MSPKKTRKSTGRLNWRRLLGGLLAACLLLLLTTALRQGALQDLLQEFLPAQKITPGLTLHMIDVGQGQALLLTCGGKSAMVDTGLPDTSDDVVNYLWRQGVRKLDYLFVTHPHNDHCGGAKDVVERIGTDVLVVPEYLSQEAALATAGDWVGKTNTPIAVTHAGQQYQLGEAAITVLHPAAGNDIDDMNDLSLVLLVEYGGKRLLFTGDISQTVEQELTDIGTIDLLQVPHHGSNTSSSQAFLEAISPDYGLISCGRNNDYGHPHEVVLSRLEAAGAEIFRTDLSGTLVVTVHEGQISVKTENES